jgi:glyoxylase-like metal-dependent hydrolase (beta-lactamase superfamily II)
MMLSICSRANPALVVVSLLTASLLIPARVSAQQTGEPLRPEWCRDLPRPEYKNLELIDAHNSWFEVYRIRPGVFAIYEPHQFEEVISYLILGKRRSLLFDTGLGVGAISQVVRQLTPLPITVLNSHTHFDHTGGNAELAYTLHADIMNQDLPFAHTNAQGQSNIYSHDALAPDRLCGPLPAGVTPAAYAIRPWHVSHLIKDGERIALGDRDLEIIFTPGHTPDSLCLLDRKNGLLFTGDTFYLGPIYLFTPETDFAAYTRSINKLARLAASLNLLLPGHNVPVADPAYLLRLHDAVEKVNSRAIKPVVTEGRREYRFDHFSLLLAPN